MGAENSTTPPTVSNPLLRPHGGTPVLPRVRIKGRCDAWGADGSSGTLWGLDEEMWEGLVFSLYLLLFRPSPGETMSSYPQTARWPVRTGAADATTSQLCL